MKMEFLVGTNIDSACEKACKFAHEVQRPAEFHFNGVDVVVQPGERPEVVRDRWQAAMDKTAEDYRNSPKGKASEAESKAVAKRQQAYVDKAIRELPGIINDQPKLMNWFKGFTENADHVDVRFDRYQLIDDLFEAGYRDDQHTDGTLPKEVFETDRKIVAEYVVGQVLSCLRRGMPPHPITMKFVEDYQKIATKD